MEIRVGRLSDVEGITDIFNFYIEHTNARFEEEKFTLENRQQWFTQFSNNSKHQLYVAIENGALLGFACSQQYRAMSAFEDTVEVTVYLAEEATGKGLGSKLYSQLFSSIRTHGVHRALSGVALPNDASIALHKSFGFREVGVFNEYAKKNGQYISSMWLEKVFNRESG
ncbi:GNAT family N-acetyltransferase [Vibrio lentus]|uniref:GNAT family N-acetyltransferase n=1 Tax=Vibrio lentus TaxID=136468 RepID=A0A2N7C5D6_9VIBR|nr:GNAT family N-acetyltransferase [Vibrio lentus]PME53472.1 GNAT family N-acetyltransferase [Vibrio lentus]PME70661.1 GNAT family N-acetyltransferase [Vibrio lentus]PME95273.1 GNAT family N-acetyltransferase [Vibrio lentus]PMG66372.1 GNAT family N-acetyltransferase [Vibrio lentus]PMH93820.1 GNAT family N-acetyltransferase [Vibrio lentus]